MIEEAHDPLRASRLAKICTGISVGACVVGLLLYVAPHLYAGVGSGSMYNFLAYGTLFWLVVVLGWVAAVTGFVVGTGATHTVAGAMMIVFTLWLAWHVS